MNDLVEEVLSLSAGARARIVRPGGLTDGPLVLCLPGDAPDGWRGKTSQEIAVRLARCGIGCAILSYARLQKGGLDICPLPAAISATEVLIARMSARGQAPVGAMASSFGAAVLLALPSVAAVQHALVFKSPAIDLASAYLSELGSAAMRTWAKAPAGTPLRDALDAVLTARGAASAPMIDVPALVLHGTQDPVVPFAQAELLASLLPQACLQALSGGDHRFSDRAQWSDVINASVDHFHRCFQTRKAIAL